MIENYEKYLELIQTKIDSMFEKQKPYIFCKKGCSLCCEKGEYPFTEIEFKYLMIGFSALDAELQEKIKKKAEKIKEDRRNFKEDGIFMYECPFLIDKTCTVYKHRGLICRNFGLILQREGKKPTIPFCSSLNLNYSNVYDTESNTVSIEMFKKLNIDIEPKIFNVGYEALINKAFAEGYGFEFGEKRRIIDWF